MSMGRITAGVVASVLSISLLACGGATQGEQPTAATPVAPTTDAATTVPATSAQPVTNSQVAEAFQKALQERWTISLSQPEEFESAAAYQQGMTACIDAELNALAKLDGATFEDAEVGSAASAYLQGLRDQKGQFEDYARHPTLREYNYRVINENVRRASLRILADKAGLSFAGEDATRFKDLLAPDDGFSGERVIDDLFTASECRGLESLGDGFWGCEVKVSNNTHLSFDRATFTARFYDADGVQLHEESRFVDNMEAGSVIWQQFTCNSTDVPATVKLTAYMTEETDPTGKDDYILRDDCPTVDPAAITVA